MSEGWNSRTRAWRSRCGLTLVAAVLALGPARAAENTLALAPDPDQNRAEYEQVSKEITLSSERLAKLAADVATVKKDHASISAALIQSAMTEQKLGQDIEDIGARLEGLKAEEEKLHASLVARRDVLAEVLGALQRMGLNPPPAILVKPEDALSSVRSAILLGAVVPELRQQTDKLLSDLKEQTRVTASIEAERARLTAAVTEQTAEKKRLTMLLEAKKKLQADTETALAAEQQHSQQLAARAGSLKDLIASLEADKARKAADQAKAAERKSTDSDTTASTTEPAPPLVPEGNRLTASAPFAALQGQIALPVIGKIKRRFGTDDGNGAMMQGDMVATQSGAIVTAPADGNVLYAGPFRSYGQLLILNAGDGYHVVLAGMSRISVATGQSVLAGEPVGAMGEARVASTSASQNGNATLELYVEFRKDGNPSIRPLGGRTDFLEGREMMRKLSLLFAGALIGASAMSLVYGAPGSAANAAGSETYKQLAIFGDIFERVRAQYVTPPDDKSLVENAINGMLASLDPHSSYMNAEQAQDMRVQTKGEFGGLGIEVTMENDLVKVITPIDDTPAAKAGVLAGDYIAKIDGEEVRGLTLNDAVEKMRGPVNTPIKLTILRQGADKPIELTVVRDIIKVKAVKYRVENDVGYMKITSFTEKTYDDLENAIENIKKQVPNDKLKGYVLDLRLNPGGLLDQAVSVSDAFLKRGEIVSTRGRDPKDVTRFDAKPKQNDDIGGKPLIVLVNGGSASASEIVAGALQDLRRATVVGTQSFGKGSVQTIIPLGENGALRLTTALYYTPSGKSIQGKGITPDIKVDQPLPPDLQGRDLTRGESDLKGHIKGADESSTGSGSAAYVPPEPKDDLQLIYAEQLLRGQKTDPSFPPNPDKAVLNQ